MDPFGFLLFWTFWGLLDLDVYLIPQVRVVFSHYFFHKDFCPFLALFSFWDPCNVTYSAWCCPIGLLSSLHFLKFFFHFVAIWVNSIALLAHRPFLLPYLVCCWIPVVYFSVIIFFSNVSSVWSYLYFLSLCWVQTILFPSLVSTFMIITYLHFSKLSFFFPKVLSCSFIWNIFLYFPICTLCVSFYVLGKILPLLVLKKWPYVEMNLTVQPAPALFCLLNFVIV